MVPVYAVQWKDSFHARHGISNCFGNLFLAFCPFLLLFILLLIFKGLVRSSFIGKSFHLWVSSLSDHIVSKIYSHMTENMIPGGQE